MPTNPDPTSGFTIDLTVSGLSSEKKSQLLPKLQQLQEVVNELQSLLADITQDIENSTNGDNSKL